MTPPAAGDGERDHDGGDALTLALAQIEVEPAAVERNLDRALEAIAQAASEGADLVALPELFATGYFAFGAYERTAEGLDGPTISALADAAREHSVAVLAGSIVEDLSQTAGGPAEEGLANTAVLLDRAGERRLAYRKRNLFGYGSREPELLTPGESLPTATLDGVTLGVTTCYDLRFPEEYRRLAAAGADCVLVPSAWPYPRLEHWSVLPRARAIENAAYVATANGVGDFEEATLLGRSTVHDPWGTPVASSGDESALVTATVDPARVQAVREEFPAARERLATESEADGAGGE